VTPTVTATTTIASSVPKQRRAPAPTPRAILRRATAADEVDAIAGVILAGTSDISIPIDSSILADIASACNCLAFGAQYTVTTTLTDVPVVRIS
jgi:hypothetical protein